MPLWLSEEALQRPPRTRDLVTTSLREREGFDRRIATWRVEMRNVAVLLEIANGSPAQGHSYSVAHA